MDGLKTVYRDRISRHWERYSEPYHVAKVTPQRVYVYRAGQDGPTFVLKREELESKGGSWSNSMRALFYLRPRAKRETSYYRNEFLAPEEICWFYQELEIEPPVTASEVKKAFRQKAKERHPDLGGSDEPMAKLIKAYKIALKYTIPLGGHYVVSYSQSR